MTASTITLDVLNNAVTSALPNGTPEEQGNLLADLVRKLHGEITPKPAPVRKAPVRKAAAVKADPSVGTGAAMKANWNGQMMKSDKGTATSGQVKWLVSNGVKPATARNLSMVAASNMRAKLTGKIA